MNTNTLLSNYIYFWDFVWTKLDDEEKKEAIIENLNDNNVSVEDLNHMLDEIGIMIHNYNSIPSTRNMLWIIGDAVIKQKNILTEWNSNNIYEEFENDQYF